MIAADWIFLLVIAFLVGYWIGGRKARRVWMVDADRQIKALQENSAIIEKQLAHDMKSAYKRNQDQVQQAAADFRSKAQEYLDERSASKKASGNAVLIFLAGHLESNEPDNTFDLARFRYIEGVVGFGPDFFDYLSSLPKTATRQEAAARIRELVEQKASKP